MAKKSQKKKEWCKSYRARGQREKNKKIKMLKHALKHSNDKVTWGHKLLNT